MVQDVQRPSMFRLYRAVFFVLFYAWFHRQSMLQPSRHWRKRTGLKGNAKPVLPVPENSPLNRLPEVPQPVEVEIELVTRPLTAPPNQAHRTREKMELTQTQKAILAKLKELNAEQAVALEKRVTSYADFQEIEKREDEIIVLHRELIESVRLALVHESPSSAGGRT